MEAAAAPQMFSLDFSDTMRPHGVDEATSPGIAQGGGGSDPAAMEAIAAALQLFDLCHPAEDSTISADDLAKVLRSHLGGDAEAERILGLLCEGDHSGRPPDSFNFLNYWQGMDRFFEENGAFGSPSSAGAEGEVDTIKGMQRFRDGVLSIARVNGLLSEETISSIHLCDLLKDIRAVATDPNYWDEVMQAVPAEEGFGLTLPEVAEAVYIWLKDFLKGELDASGANEAEGMSPPQMVEAGAESPEQDEDTPVRMIPALSGVPPQVKRSRSQRLSTIEGLGPALGGEMRRAHELHELISQRTPEDNVRVHDALAHLSSLHDNLFSSLLGRQREIDELKREVASISEKKDHAEEELAHTVQFTGELDHKFAAAERQRDESARKVAGLEDQVKALTRHSEDLEQALHKTEAQHEGHEDEERIAAKKTMQVQNRMADLERQADSAEGQAEWMRTKLGRLKLRMSIASQALHSYSECLEEGEEAASLLQKEMLEGGSWAGAKAGQPTEEAGKQLQLQQTQLQRLRQVRDDLLKAHDGWAARAPGDGNVSPRELQVHRRCTFLAAQLQALLQHTTELESLLDAGPGTGDAEEKRAKSAKLIAEGSEKSFNDFSEKLHTLEVQKADVDIELRRLQQQFAEQESQLRGVQRHRDQLLVEAGSSPGGKAKDSEKRVDNSDAGSSASGIPRGMSGAFLFDGARPVSGDLRASPKAPKDKLNLAKLKKGVRTMVHVNQLNTDAMKVRAKGESPGRRPNPLVFSMSAQPSTEYIASGQRRRSQEDRQRLVTRLKDDKGARREQKDKEGHRHKDKGPKDADKVGHRIRGKLHEKRADGGNCETQ